MPGLHTSTREHATDADPVDLTSEIQAALAALADVEARFEADQAQVEQLTGPWLGRRGCRREWKPGACAPVNPWSSGLRLFTGRSHQL